MNGMEGIFGIIGIGAGLYSLYAWFQLKFKGIINTSILVPKDTNIKKCKDKEAYRAAAGPKLLVLAVVLILYGAWQRKCDGDKRKCHARDEMPEDSDPFQDGIVLKEAFDRLNKYVVG